MADFRCCVLEVRSLESVDFLNGNTDSRLHPLKTHRSAALNVPRLVCISIALHRCLWSDTIVQTMYLPQPVEMASTSFSSRRSHHYPGRMLCAMSCLRLWFQWWFGWVWLTVRPTPEIDTMEHQRYEIRGGTVQPCKSIGIRSRFRSIMIITKSVHVHRGLYMAVPEAAWNTHCQCLLSSS